MAWSQRYKSAIKARFIDVLANMRDNRFYWLSPPNTATACQQSITGFWQEGNLNSLSTHQLRFCCWSRNKRTDRRPSEHNSASSTSAIAGPASWDSRRSRRVRWPKAAVSSFSCSSRARRRFARRHGSWSPPSGWPPLRCRLTSEAPWTREIRWRRQMDGRFFRKLSA